MRKLRMLVWGIVVLFLAAGAMVEEKPGEVARIFVLQPKAGHEQQFVLGDKHRRAWHKNADNTAD